MDAVRTMSLVAALASAAVGTTGCANFPVGWHRSPTANVSTATGHPDVPVCTVHQLTQSQLVRDLTQPYHARVYWTHQGPCRPRDTVLLASHRSRRVQHSSAPMETDAHPAGASFYPDTARAALADAIDIDGTRIHQTAGDRAFVLGGDLFPSASADVHVGHRERLARLAALLNRSAGAIVITGHTDALPIRTARFPSNDALSLARARAVSDSLRPHLTNPGRLSIVGRGDREPVASNATSEGRALNRRVEIRVARPRVASL